MNRRVPRPRRALLAAVPLLTAVYLDLPSAGPPVALPPPAARSLMVQTAPSCPLPVGQQVKAVTAFRRMLPVFRHPRCLNCHGGMDIFSKRHPGAGALDAALDPAAGPMTTEAREEFIGQCQDCHDELPGWTIPHQSVFFVGKGDEELCRQMKALEPTGEKFISHIHDDHGGIQFIAAGFAGDRALGWEGLKQYDLDSAPPPGTQPELTDKARKWVAAMGGKYVGPPDCGCVMPKIRLEIHHTEVSETPGGLPSREASEARFQVKLEAVGDNTYAGQHNLNRKITMTLPKGCTSQAARKERWSLRATIDTGTGNITVSRTALADEPTGEIVCRRGGGTARMGIFPGPAVGLLGYGDLVLPPDSGSSKTVTAKQLQIRESLTITVREPPSAGGSGP